MNADTLFEFMMDDLVIKLGDGKQCALNADCRRRERTSE